MVNFPADVRKNLRGILLPEDQEKGTRGEARGGLKGGGQGGGGGGGGGGGSQGKASQGTLDCHCTPRETHLCPKHPIPCNPSIAHTTLLHSDAKMLTLPQLIIGHNSLILTKAALRPQGHKN